MTRAEQEAAVIDPESPEALAEWAERCFEDRWFEEEDEFEPTTDDERWWNAMTRETEAGR